MSGIIFNNIGDVAVLKLNPIVAILTGFQDYFDNTINETVTRYFTREFQYSTDNITFSSWQTLTNTNLQAVSVVAGDTYYFNVRYTRAGSDSTSFLEWNYFQLDVDVTGVIIMTLNKNNYDTVFGTYRFLEIEQYLNLYNQQIIQEGSGVEIYTVVDPTIPHLNVNFYCLEDTYDLNEFFASQFGGQLLDMFGQINLDTNSGYESQPVI